MSVLDNIYEKPGCVLLVQADHISGEIIGTVIDDLYKAGAYNVQVVPTVTKKNRPGYIFFIDIAPGDNLQVESIIIREIGATGWHRIETGHRHVGTEIRHCDVVFDTPEGPLSYTAAIKVVRERQQQIRPEHSSCLALRETLREKGVELSLNEINRSIIEQVMKTSEN